MFCLTLRAAASALTTRASARAACGPRCYLQRVAPLQQRSSRSIVTTAVVKLASPSRGSAHDAKLSSLLDSELRYEKSAIEQHRHQPKAAPPAAAQPPAGFAVTKREGTQFTLARKCEDDGSLLEVSFDLNGSTISPHDENEADVDQDETADSARAHPEGDAEGGEPAAAEEEIHSRPDLIFRVRKPASQTCLTVRCSFPPVHVSRQMAAEDPDYPTLSIDTVAVEGGASELGAYELEADMLNDDLYKQLAEMLVHRGVTRDFENALVEYCTAQEHQLYLRFLAEAKKFCDA